MAIISPLPNNITNGTTGDATQVMADLNQIVSNVNTNAAENGANSSITSLSGLVIPLTLAQGGVGSGTASGARANIGAAASGANTDITSLSSPNITTPTISAPTITGTAAVSSATFSGSVIVPSAALSTQAINKGQADAAYRVSQ